MKISERSISALAKIVTGDSQISPYRSGPVLVRLFNEFGANDVLWSRFSFTMVLCGREKLGR